VVMDIDFGEYTLKFSLVYYEKVNFLLLVLGFELRASCLLSSCSTTIEKFLDLR
jgi:hypothetical protein